MPIGTLYIGIGMGVSTSDIPKVLAFLNNQGVERIFISPLSKNMQDVKYGIYHGAFMGGTCEFLSPKAREWLGENTSGLQIFE